MQRKWLELISVSKRDLFSKWKLLAADLGEWLNSVVGISALKVQLHDLSMFF